MNFWASFSSNFSLMKQFTLTACAVFTMLSAFGQTPRYTVDQTSAESVVNALFYAAQTRDFEVLRDLCDDTTTDMDAKRVCSLAAVADQIASYGGSEKSKLELESFIKAFEMGRIAGNFGLSVRSTGEFHEVPVLIDRDGDGNLEAETIILIKRREKLYITSL